MKDALEKMIRGESLTAPETAAVFESFLADGAAGASDEEISAYLTASSKRLPEAAELAGAASVLRRHMLRVETAGLPQSAVLVDTCGTGGSGLSSFNTSTVVAFFAAAAGLYVAKHGNRSISSACGSADVLEALGVRADLGAPEAAKALARDRFVFLFAPLYHPATKRVQGIRRKLGVRTIFNFLGPLCNPAGVGRQLLGVSDVRMVPVMAEALRELGTEHALVVCGEDGLDEVTLNGKTHVTEVRDGEIRSFTVAPENFGLKQAPLSAFAGSDPAGSAALVRELLAGKKDARTDIVLLNAGATFFIGGVSETWAAGVDNARTIHESGALVRVLEHAAALAGRS